MQGKDRAKGLKGLRYSRTKCGIALFILFLAGALAFLLGVVLLTHCGTGQDIPPTDMLGYAGDTIIVGQVKKVCNTF